MCFSVLFSFGFQSFGGKTSSLCNQHFATALRWQAAQTEIIVPNRAMTFPMHLNGALTLEPGCDNLNANTVKPNSPEQKHTQLESVKFN